MKKILLIDDENSIARLVGSMAGDAGYAFAYAEDGAEGLVVAEREAPDLVIMDVMMPRMDGFTTCRLMRERGITCPVIFLSAKGVQDVAARRDGRGRHARAAQVGLDVHEQLARIERLHHVVVAAGLEAHALVHDVAGRFVLDRGQFRVTKDGERLSLTPKEFKIFFALASSPGLVLSKEQLVEAAWGKEFVGETSSITVFIKKLREKVEDDPSDPRVIQTVWGIGYRFEPEGREG